jgi:hypothetical protein
MDTLLIFLTSLGAAVLANRLARRGPLTVGDIASGVVSGGLGVGLALILSGEGAGSHLGLPLLIAFCFPFGLQSFQRQAPESNK